MREGTAHRPEHGACDNRVISSVFSIQSILIAHRRSSGRYGAISSQLGDHTSLDRGPRPHDELLSEPWRRGGAPPDPGVTLRAVSAARGGT